MSDLYSLYKLHKIDSTLYGLKMEAESLDVGQDEKREQKQVEKDGADVLGNARSLSQEAKDIELQQKGLQEKITSFNKKLYDGSIVSPKEIENIERELTMLRDLLEKHDGRLLELYELIPVATEAAKSVNAKLAALQKAVEVKRARAVERHGEIKKEFDATRSQRPAAAKAVEKDVLDRYEEVRKRTGSTAMAVVTDDGRCSDCGISVPEKQMKDLDHDRLTFCQGCHRIMIKLVAEKC